jgi:hypothetical protein
LALPLLPLLPLSPLLPLLLLLLLLLLHFAIALTSKDTRHASSSRRDC